MAAHYNDCLYALAQVWGAYDNLHNKNVAIKKFKEVKTANGGVAAHALREISVLRRVTSHKGIVTLVDVLEPLEYSSNNIIMVMEREDSDLEHWIENNDVSVGQADFILYQMLKACNYLHRNYIMHRYKIVCSFCPCDYLNLLHIGT